MPETTAAEPAAPAIDPKAATPATDKAAPAEAAEPTKDYILNGKPVKLTEKQATAYVQKGLFADQKLKSMEVLQGRTKALIEDLKTPEGILKVLRDPALGNSPKEVLRKLMASEVVDDELKEEISKWVYDNVVVKGKMTPEQIEQEKKLSEYERLKKQEEDRKMADLSAQQKAQVQAVYQAVRSEVTKQILADKTFPQTEGSIRAVVEKLRVMNRQGAPITEESVTKALALVKKDHLLHQQELFDKIEDPEALIAFFGEERALKISKALVARLKSKEKAQLSKQQDAGDGTKEKVTDRIDRKLGRTPQGYHVLDF